MGRPSIESEPEPYRLIKTPAAEPVLEHAHHPVKRVSGDAVVVGQAQRHYQ